MKKLYSIVLMAAALLIGTNVWAVDVSSWDNLKANMKNGGEITLTASFEVTAPSASTDATWAGIWIGAETEDGAAPNVVLNLNGKTITINAGRNNQVLYPFVLTKGSLVVNGPGKIVVTKGEFTKLGEGTNVFFVFGQKDAEVADLKDPKTDPYSHLTIGRNVEVETANGSCIVVDQLTSTHQGYINKVYTTDPAKQLGYTIANYAFGARVDVDGKLSSIGGTKCYGIKANGNLKTPADEKKMYAPYICILDSAEIYSDNSAVLTASTAVYASGYAQWTIKGKCEGATGLYASSGKIEVEGADIASQATDYAAPGGTGHANGLGSAIVINSRTNYGGEVELEVSGDTHVESKSGFAIEEVVNTSDNQTKVEAITINAGTFQGGTNPNTGEDQAAIIMSNQTSTDADVVVYGGTIEGPVVVNGDDGKSLSDFLGPEVHTTTVYINGNPNTVVSKGDVPDVYASIAGHANEAVKWSGDNETLKGDITLAELEINKMDTTWNSAHTKITAITPHAQVLYVGDADHDVTLKVGRVVLGPGAQVIVNAGSKLIVTGEQGFVAPLASNFVLQANEAKRATFLFHPNVTSNRHPSATVEFFSKSFVDGSNYASQRFGIPTFGELTSVEAVNSETSAAVRTRFYNFNQDANSWISLGYINGGASDPAFDKAQMATPFAYYQMYNYATTANTKVIMKGQLFGNDSPELSVRGNFWNGYANTYMGPLNIQELIDMIPNTVDKAIYLYDITATQATWNPINLVLVEEEDAIQPLQPFLVRNANELATVPVNYADVVYYTPSGSGEKKPGASPAPARCLTNAIATKAKLIVKGENCIDRVTVAEGADFSAEFDNGYDAAKYMNDGINMYVSADEKMSIFATDNLDNTYVGLQTVNGGNYTIEFANVQGEELTLIDHETGARVAMVEGNTYEFTAAANSVNDYRFEIVESAKLPTAIENTEAVKSAKGVYTITGQYVGEMNVWNTLPAGIYVVNGEKRVK